MKKLLESCEYHLIHSESPGLSLLSVVRKASTVLGRGHDDVKLNDMEHWYLMPNVS